MFQPPVACRREGALTFAAVCDIDLDAFTPDVVTALALDGYACIRGPDWEMLAGAMDLGEESRDG
jgi:hypothetical protein